MIRRSCPTECVTDRPGSDLLDTDFSPSGQTPAGGLHTPVRLVEVTAGAGIQFQHNNGAYGGKLLPETLGAGCAFLDYDGDGWQDILLVNGTDWPGHKRKTSTLKLYRNNRNGTFTDVTKTAGLEIEMYGMGVAVGDFNNDGFPDVFVTAVGQNRLADIAFDQADRRRLRQLAAQHDRVRRQVGAVAFA